MKDLGPGSEDMGQDLSIRIPDELAMGAQLEVKSVLQCQLLPLIEYVVFFSLRNLFSEQCTRGCMYMLNAIITEMLEVEMVDKEMLLKVLAEVILLL